MKSESFSAPALARGLDLLHMLSQDGQSSLESLASRTKCPKSSTLRYLKTLEQMNLVTQLPESRHWQALSRILPIRRSEAGLLAQIRTQLPFLAEKSGHCAELYRVQGRHIELIDRTDPVESEVKVLARIGYQRELTELDATVAVYFANCSTPPPASMWAWTDGVRHTLPDHQRDYIIQDVRDQGVACDVDFNENGIRRFACPLHEHQQLAGILAIAQRQTPRAEREKENILSILRNSPQPITPSLT